MFSKISRYRNLPDVTVLDSKGRVLASRSLRLPPEVSGTFRHTVVEGDRLDHLAFKYYEQPRDWWRIADANPEFLSPQAMLGDGPQRTVRIPLVSDGPSPRWSELLKTVRESSGVETVVLGSDEQPQATVEVVEGPPAFAIDPALTAELDASVRQQTIAPALAAALAAEGVGLTGDVRPAKVDAVTWRITELATRRIYSFRHFADQSLLNVHESAFRFRWIAEVTHNAHRTSTADLLDLIVARGFAVGQATEVRRIGKPMIVPPRTD